ncbi:hypothetical protein J437_LFUL005810 [Ladona fulva]|uniref:Proteasome inhibitor PI31 subunit n=1 Tax=Ladona fulva TaxID=123851 RepID=A0A8K0K0U2_LADFU|nr:hypothetical protein J437_LFUL005810 [Ladona fulva]
MSNTYIGWELFYHSVESSLTKKEDILIAFVHFVLIKHGFRCFGFDKEANQEHQNGSELLPATWNTKENLSLKYKLREQNFVLQVTKSEGTLIFNLLNPVKVEASSVVFEIASSVSGIKGSLGNVIPNHDELRLKLEESLLKPMAPETLGIKSVAVQTVTESSSLRVERDVQPNPRPHAERNPESEQYFDPFGVGRSDLDPLGRLGGGNLFQPPRRGGINPGLGVPGGLPRGSIPPGARFDPFGPPDIDNRPRRGGFGRMNPDHDHMPPPGFDDMFM